MRVDWPVTEFVYDPMTFYRYFNRGDIDVHDLCLLNDDVCEIVYSRKNEFTTESGVTNILIGIFTTSYARLELYKMLKLIGEDVLYMDTDS